MQSFSFGVAASPFALVLGLVAAAVTTVVLAVRRAIERQTGIAFADLATAAAVGFAVGLVPALGSAIALRSFPRPRRGRWQQEGWTSYTPEAPPSVAEGGFGTAVGSMDRFDKFTPRARKVLTLAQDEAQRFNHNYIGTEHLLLGLLREGEGVAARALENLGVELTRVRTAVEFIIGRGGAPVVGEVGLTPRAKRVIELAIDEARRLEHNYVGTEHLLLGLVREGAGIAAGVLASLGVDLDKVRGEVIGLTREGPGGASA